MPFFVRPIARSLCGNVQQKLIDPNLQQATTFLEDHLADHRWIAGPDLTVADFQMSFAVSVAGACERSAALSKPAPVPRPYSRPSRLPTRNGRADP